MPSLSQNTQAILLLTAPLIAGRGSSSSELLTPGEYKRLARHLREIQRQQQISLHRMRPNFCEPVSQLLKKPGCNAYWDEASF